MVPQPGKMVVTDTVKRWIVRGNGDMTKNHPSMRDFLEFLKAEQNFWNPQPGSFMAEPVPGTSEAWSAIEERLKADPQPEREAELKARFQNARQTFRDRSREWEDKDRYIERDDFEYLHRNFITHERYVFWALTHPTAEDKVMALSNLPDTLLKKSDVGFPVVVHVAQFDDVQEGLGEDVRTGYKIVHDILTDELIISKIEFGVPDEKKAFGLPWHPRPLHEEWSYFYLPKGEGEEGEKGEWEYEWNHVANKGRPSTETLTRRSTLFRGSPAALATLIIRKPCLSTAIRLNFDHLLRFIAADWILANALAILMVEHPAEHRGTFTDELYNSLWNWMDINRFALRRLKITTLWTKDMVDLTGFEINTRHAKKKKRQAKARAREAEREARLETEREAGEPEWEDEMSESDMSDMERELAESWTWRR